MKHQEKMIDYVKKDAEENGYYVCPDEDLLEDLISGLVDNEKRYGYASCPCRAASAVKQYDVDIICPCEYRDADVNEYGMCYCGLFVSEEVHEDPSKLGPIPERRPESIIDAGMEAKEKGTDEIEIDEKEELHVWRCTVCGYLAAREKPPPICPICKAKAERFVKFEM